MKNLSRIAIVAIAILSKVSTCQAPERAQNTKAVNEQAILPTITINLAGGKPLIGLPPSSAIGSPMLCSPDGTTFIEIYATAKNAVSRFPDLYSISTLGEVTRLNRPLPTEYERLFLRSLFPGEHTIASLIQAYGKKDLSPDSRKSEIDFISLIDHDGGSPKLIELKLNFQPLKIAMLNSGKFLILGLDTVNLVPILAFLNEDGTFSKSIDLDNRNYDKSQELQKTYNGKNSDELAAKHKQILDALSSASFVPHGSQVLLVQPGSNLPVHILDDKGDEGTIAISLPHDFLVQNILGSDQSNTWVIRAQKLDSFQKMANEHVIINPEQQLFAISQETGQVAEILNISGVAPMMVTCAANKKLIAFYDDPPPGSDPDVDRFVLATAPR